MKGEPIKDQLGEMLRRVKKDGGSEELCYGLVALVEERVNAE